MQSLKAKNQGAEGTRKNVAVVGARGYSGTELCRLLLKHPDVKLAAAVATDAKFMLSDVLPDEKAALIPTWSLADLETNLSSLHTLFLATPAEVSIDLAADALAAGVNVIDLSGAFRLPGSTDAETESIYKKWYGFAHTAPAFVANATYGLQPFAKPHTGNEAKLIANPGCFSTAILLALIPLLKAGVIATDSIVIDAKSGTTGAGRKAEEKLLFSEVEGECRPYKVAAHQHFPEIVHAASAFSGGVKISPFFTTHLMNVRRGILASIYAKASGELEGQAFEAKIKAAFNEAYSHYPLVQVGALDTNAGLTSLKRVVGSPRTQISYKVDGDKLYLFSALDNLLKGAASQAVENFNHLLDRPLNHGLSGMEGVL